MALSIKFPIGARVTHRHGGPATVVGHPFKGGAGTTYLPVKFDNPYLDDGSRGWFEEYFTLLDEPIPSGGWARDTRTVNLVERYESAKHAHHEFYEAHKAEVRKNIEMQRELDAAKAEIERRVADIDRLESDLRFIRKTLDTVRRTVQ